jgi:hypothetical protein
VIDFLWRPTKLDIEGKSMKTKASILLMLTLIVVAADVRAQERPTDIREEPLPESTEEQLETAVQRQSALLNRLFGVDMQTTGAIPMALKARNPLHLINPLAPAEYGNGFDNTTIDLQSGQAEGISIFGVRF